MASDNDMKRITRGLSNIEGSNPDYTGTASSPQEMASRTLIRRTYTFEIASVLANGSNAIVSNATEAQRMIGNGRVLGAYLLPHTTQTAAGPDNTTYAVHKLSGSAGSGTAVASATSNTSANGGTGNLAVAAAVSLTVTDEANARFTKGAWLAPNVSQNASGSVSVTGSISVDVELEGPADDYGI